MPEHFAERHGLIIIIALGESIVAIGAGVTGEITAGVVATAVIGIALAAAMWWAYFDVVALVATRRLASITDRQERNEMARDSYSYLHLPMVAGIVLVALGMKKTIGHFDEPLKIETATALIGGFCMYLLAHVAFRWRNVHSVNRRRLFLGIALLALIPAGVELPALATLSILTAIACALIAYEAIRYADHRDRVRHEPGRSGLEVLLLLLVGLAVRLSGGVGCLFPARHVGRVGVRVGVVRGVLDQLLLGQLEAFGLALARLPPAPARTRPRRSHRRRRRRSRRPPARLPLPARPHSPRRRECLLRSSRIPFLARIVPLDPYRSAARIKRR